MLLSFDINQPDSRRLGELRVQAEHVDREGHLVNDSLAGTVLPVEKLKILDAVVLPVPVDMMDRFVGEKAAAKVSRHHPAVFHDGVFFAGDKRRNGYPSVPIAFDVPTVLPAIKASESRFPLVFRLACSVAKLLLHIKPTAWLSSVATGFVAIEASERRFGFRNLAATNVGTFHRAIKWVSIEFLPIVKHQRS